MENKSHSSFPIIDKINARWQALSQREKIMLNVLLWVLILAGCWLFVSISGGEQKEVSTTITRMEKQIRELEQAIPFKDQIEEQSAVYSSLLEQEKLK